MVITEVFVETYNMVSIDIDTCLLNLSTIRGTVYIVVG